MSDLNWILSGVLVLGLGGVAWLFRAEMKHLGEASKRSREAYESSMKALSHLVAISKILDAATAGASPMEIERMFQEIPK